MIGGRAAFDQASASAYQARRIRRFGSCAARVRPGRHRPQSAGSAVGLVADDEVARSEDVPVQVDDVVLVSTFLMDR